MQINLFLFFYLLITHLAYAEKTNPFYEIEIERSIKSMSIEEKAGQLLLVGFTGKYSEPGIKKIITKVKPGGIIIFKKNMTNISHLYEMNEKAHAFSKKETGLPLLIAVDQEGGVVTRIKTKPPLPSAMTIGMAKDTHLAEKIGYINGRLLKSLGFNMNLAPVFDLSDLKDHSFIGTRGFGNDPDLVSSLGTSYAAGLHYAGVLPTAKHFPGHGHISTDPHFNHAVRNDTIDTLKASHLKPFIELSKKPYLSSMMVAHISFPEIDKENLPSTFSKPIITDILRKDIGYDGLVVTDDILMNGAKKIKDPADRAIKAIQAGADFIMIAWSQRNQLRIRNHIVKAVKAGLISEERIDQSLRRIIKAKLEYRPKKNYRELLDEEIKTLSLWMDENLEKIFETLFQKQLSSMSIEGNHFTVISPYSSFNYWFKQSFTQNNVKTFKLSKRPNLKKTIQAIKKHNNSNIFFFAPSKSSILLAEKIPTSLRSKISLITTWHPSAIKSGQTFKNIFSSYSYHPKLGYFLGKSLKEKAQLRHAKFTNKPEKVADKKDFSTESHVD